MAEDRLRYFRQEAREILEGLTRGLLEIEKGAPREPVLGEVLRLAHTLKGAAGVVRLPAVAAHAHEMEDLLQEYRGSSSAIPASRIDEALRVLDAMKNILAGLVPVSADAPRSGRESMDDRTFETIRVEVRDMQTLCDGIAEATVQTDALQHVTNGLMSRDGPVVRCLDQLDLEWKRCAAPARKEPLQRVAEALRESLSRVQRTLQNGIHRVQQELAEIRGRASDLRLLPAGVLFSELERAVRDAAQLVGKKVAFEGRGERERLDANVLASIRGALLHVVRNAVVHGIEAEGGRIEAGKPMEGRVTLQVKRRGHRVSFQCHDDGRGIDLEAVRRACVEQRLLSEAEARRLEVDQALRVIFEAGVTTIGTAHRVAGRGVGLDVVRNVAARLKGQAQARSEPGRGMVVEIIVPVSLTSLRTLGVEQGRTRASVPFAAVRRVLRVYESDIASSGDGSSVLFEGRAIPFGTLSALTGDSPPGVRRSRFRTAVVVEADSGTVALGVDRLLGARDEVMKPTPALAGDLGVIAGASFDSEGNPSLVLDPVGLVEAVRRRGARPGDTAIRQPDPVLVIDDSLTTRMLEQSLLEANGYEVDLAVSGEEGLALARKRGYAVCLCDVEMPGMNGFEFLETVRSDPELRELPVILVTTLSSDKDRRRGLASGAAAYMVKSEFDEGVLLRAIRGASRSGWRV